jgi:Tn3 transposase DDE domain
MNQIGTIQSAWSTRKDSRPAIPANTPAISGTRLIIHAIVVWISRYVMVALDHLRRTDFPVNDSDLKPIAPLIWEHINVHGSYHFDLREPRRR